MPQHIIYQNIPGMPLSYSLFTRSVNSLMRNKHSMYISKKEIGRGHNFMPSKSRSLQDNFRGKNSNMEISQIFTKLWLCLATQKVLLESRGLKKSKRTPGDRMGNLCQSRLKQFRIQVSTAKEKKFEQMLSSFERNSTGKHDFKRMMSAVRTDRW